MYRTSGHLAETATDAPGNEGKKLRKGKVSAASSNSEIVINSEKVMWYSGMPSNVWSTLRFMIC